MQCNVVNGTIYRHVYVDINRYNLVFAILLGHNKPRQFKYCLQSWPIGEIVCHLLRVLLAIEDPIIQVTLQILTLFAVLGPVVACSGLQHG